MKNLLLLIALLLCSICHAQDCKFLQQLKEPVTIDGARKLAVDLANKTVNDKYYYCQEKVFKDRGIYVMMFTPECYTQEEVETKKHVANCFGIYFTVSGNTYTFRKIISNYDDIYPVWSSLFSKAKKDNKSHTISVQGTDAKFSLIEDAPYWVIKG